MADRWLHNDFTGKISNIGLVLGTDYDELIPMTTILFGKAGNQSSYIDTEVGVVIAGNVNRMMNNLLYLPVHQIISSCGATVAPFPGGPVSSIITYENDNPQEDCIFESNVISNELKKLDLKMFQTLNIDKDSEESSDISINNQEIVQFMLETCERDTDGR